MHQLPNGYYFATKHIFNFINCVNNNKLTPERQVDILSNRPDQMIRYIPQPDPIVADSLKASYERRVGNLAEYALPAIRSEVIPIAEKSRKEKDKITLSIKARSDKSPVSKIHLIVNGVEEDLNQLKYGKNLSLDNSIELSPGDNQIEIFAEDSLRNFSNKIIFSENYKSRKKPKLYLICIGSSRFEFV